MPLDLSQNEQTLQIGNGHIVVLPENAYVRQLLRIITKIFYIVMCTILCTIISPFYLNFIILVFIISYFLFVIYREKIFFLFPFNVDY